MITVLLLTASNIFMTFAWYGHLKFPHRPMWLVILASWGIAFFEYCLMVPANRIGYGQFSAFQLKVIQEAITVIVFLGVAFFYLKETPRWNHILALLFIFLAVYSASLAPPERA